MPAPLMDRFPSISDLESRAKRRIPSFAWEYLASGTGDESLIGRNVSAMADVQFVPEFLKGPMEPVVETELFGVSYAAPIGIAPIGLTGLIWPGADAALAAAAVECRIPYTLSTVATEKPEVAGPAAQGMGWFQLYPPKTDELRTDIVRRAQDSGFTTMVVTADIPWPSRRERQRKAQVRVPPVIGPTLIAQAGLRPAWTKALLQNGMPHFRMLESYAETSAMRDVAGFVGASLGNTLSWEYLEAVRVQWDGPLVVKGILSPDDAQRCVDAGADGVQVSNHGARQLDGALASIHALPAIVEKVGSQTKILFDSGIRSGLDVARALALGADLVFCGRAFMFGLGALGPTGVQHAFEILNDGLINTLHQTGCERIDQLADRLAR
jgi:L-lactate dehydrogenase (cytochrome)